MHRPRCKRIKPDSIRCARLEQYLSITAPFDGVITERNVHPGALVGPQGAGGTTPMLRIEQVQKLRLTVPVPESIVGAIAEGVTATFTVRTFPGVKFTGIVKRVGGDYRHEDALDGGRARRRQHRWAPRAGHVRRRALAGEANGALALRTSVGRRAIHGEAPSSSA